MENLQTSKIFVDIAKQDLKSSKLLYDIGYYPQCIFLFQQSIEKAVKSIAIWIEITDIKNARCNIGHKGANFYKMANSNFIETVNKLKNNKDSTEAISNIMGFGNVYDDIVEFEEEIQEKDDWTDSFIKNIGNCTNLSHEHLNDIFINLEQLRAEYNLELLEKTDSFKTDDEWVQFIEETAEIMKKVIEFYSEKNVEQGISVPENLTEKVDEQFQNLLNVTDKKTWNQMVSILCDTNYVSISLFYLSILADPHAINARYPEENFNPMDFYTTDLPLVNMFPQFTDIAENILDILDNVYVSIQERELENHKQITSNSEIIV